MENEELLSYYQEPWDCEFLDPFHDDPMVGPDAADGDDNATKSDSEDSDAQVVCEPLPCVCGHCPFMPTKEEQVCCKQVKNWQREYNCEGGK